MIKDKFPDVRSFIRHLRVTTPTGFMLMAGARSDLNRQRKVAADEVIRIAGERGIHVPADMSLEEREIFARKLARTVIKPRDEVKI